MEDTEMDLVDHMLERVGDYTSDIDLYSKLRQRLRRQYGGPHVNPLIFELDAVIDGHLHTENFALWNSVGVREGDPAIMIPVYRVTEEIFMRAREVCDTNMISGILLHAAVLEYVGKCNNLFDELLAMLDETHAAMNGKVATA